MGSNVAVIDVEETGDERLAERLRPLDAAPDVRYVIVDLARCRLLTSAGLGGCLRTQRVLQARDGDLVLAAPAKHTIRVLKLTGLEEKFRTFPSRADALAWFDGQGQAQ